MTARFFASLAATLTLAGCGSVPVDTYRAETPVLDLARYFDGEVEGWGMFQDRSGQAVKRFSVVIRASWKGDTGTLDEDFTWSDGTTSKRVWTITKRSEREYAGTAADVVGTARGEAAGNALRWRYAMALEVDGKTWEVDWDDWMYLVDDRVMLNRSAMSKFGVHLGEVTISFRKK